jgi:hypothetical protein
MAVDKKMQAIMKLLHRFPVPEERADATKFQEQLKDLE